MQIASILPDPTHAYAKVGVSIFISVQCRSIIVCKSPLKMDSMVTVLPVSILLDQLVVDQSVVHMLFATLGLILK